MTPLLRLRQGVRALFAFARPVDFVYADARLSPDERALFRRMKRGEQLHSLNVLRAVESASSDRHTPPALAVAALLHDVGKSRYPLALWQKTAAVLVRAFFPALSVRLSSGDPRRIWARPFAVYALHPAWSADLLTAAGSHPDAVWLVAHHQESADQWRDHPLYLLLKRLQRADDAN